MDNNGYGCFGVFFGASGGGGGEGPYLAKSLKGDLQCLCWQRYFSAVVSTCI